MLHTGPLKKHFVSAVILTVYSTCKLSVYNNSSHKAFTGHLLSSRIFDFMIYLINAMKFKFEPV